MPLIETAQQRMIAAPFIHLNGTSAKALSEAYERARDALVQAHAHLSNTLPNARDYYPEHVNYYNLARTQHQERMNAVAQALADLEALYYHAEDNR